LHTIDEQAKNEVVCEEAIEHDHVADNGDKARRVVLKGDVLSVEAHEVAAHAPQQEQVPPVLPCCVVEMGRAGPTIVKH